MLAHPTLDILAESLDGTNEQNNCNLTFNNHSYVENFPVRLNLAPLGNNKAEQFMDSISKFID